MPAPTDRPSVHVLFGSQTGNAEVIAMDASDVLAADGFTTTLQSMDELGVADLAAMEHVLVVSSTYDDGDMPDNAQDLWDELESEAPDLGRMRFAVLALGDSSYDDFCAAGRNFDEKLGELGAHRVLDRVDCDLDYERPSREWISAVQSAFAAIDDTEERTTRRVDLTPSETQPAAWTRQKPFVTTISAADRLSGEGSAKTVFHFEIDLDDSGIEYLPGDSIGLVPVNDPDLVSRVQDLLDVSGSDRVPGEDRTWDEVLSHHVELRLPGRDLIDWTAEHSGDAELRHLLETADREALDAWLWGRDVVDLLTMVAPDQRDPAQVLALLGHLQHRSYSISSSPTDSPKEVALLVSCLQYHRDGRDRVGAGSGTFLSAGAGGQVAVFPAPNPSFRLPEDDRPAIMVGPGVGVAPFRSFLLERRARGASGRNWLFFGDQHEATDYLYRDELVAWQNDGLLSELSTAFSRDQEHKVYVQDQLVARGADVFAWLEDGASFYVCGDGAHMARAVENALVEVIATHGRMSESEARDRLADLKRERRYSQDVY